MGKKERVVELGAQGYSITRVAKILGISERQVMRYAYMALEELSVQKTEEEKEMTPPRIDEVYEEGMKTLSKEDDKSISNTE